MVEADGRLVEDVADAAQVGAELRGDALSTAGSYSEALTAYEAAIQAPRLGDTIQVDLTKPFVLPLVLSKTVTVSDFTPAVNLPANSVLYWRVRANSAAGSGAWSPISKFKSANPPGVPVLLRPLDGGVETDTTPDFDWSTSTLPAGTTFDQYEIQVSTDGTFATVDVSQGIPGRANSFFTPASDLNTDVMYYWRVRARYTYNPGESEWSAPRSFRTTIEENVQTVDVHEKPVPGLVVIFSNGRPACIPIRLDARGGGAACASA